MLNDKWMHQVTKAIVGSENVLSHDRRQAIIWTRGGVLLIGAVGKTFREIWIKIDQILLKINLKMSLAITMTS